MSSATVREAIVKFLHRELVGPDPIAPLVQEDGEEILAGDPPRIRYGAGVLFPQAADLATAADVLPVEATQTPEEDSADAPPDAGADDGSASGRFSAELTDAIDETVSLANAFLPSALGISCLSELPEGGFVASIRAAAYQPRVIEEVTPAGTVQRRQYLRKPFDRTQAIPMESLDGGAEVRVWRHPVYLEDGQPSSLELRVLSRPHGRSAGSADRLLTFSLVNNHRAASGKTENEKCFFQVELRIHALDETPCFLEYPAMGRAIDDEEASMALLYRHRKTYAIGHGCSADWEEACEGRASSIQTQIIPGYEIKPIVPNQFEELALRMVDLSDLRDADGALAILDGLCSRYERWVLEQQTTAEGSDFPAEHRPAALRHLSHCRQCLLRMQDGVRLLKESPKAMRAFGLANRAMLLQQLHHSLPLRDWRLEKGENLTIQPVSWPDVENPPAGKGSWYPFQLAFILMNLRPLWSPADSERNIIDLIWFPTGGGKTEAYLGLTAFAILVRRLHSSSNGGTTVLMRYTLRLLTAQQFQRAAALVCALEMMREGAHEELGSDPITVGLWAGSDLTPNDRERAVTALANLASGETRENPFAVLKCPWCGAQMGQIQSGTRSRVVGYVRERNPSRVVFRCRDANCRFSLDRGLPLLVVDEDMYEQPPTVLIGTVDKFAMMTWFPQSRAFFGLGQNRVDPPDLIIQDELHLISGPLGSMVGQYETIIQEFCTRPHGEQRVSAKIVASTATISRAAEQCHALWGCGPTKVFQFPPQCLRAGESFFATEDESAPGRLYVGVHASALPSHVTAQIRVLSALLQAPLTAEADDERDRDPYWTLITYFNSLRELGHAATLVRADIREYLNAMWLRLGLAKPSGAEPDRRRFINLDLELTSRIPSAEIPQSLQRLEREYPRGDERPVDICLATNMLAVGVDVPRLGMLSVVGQPKTTSEYIQATSRVGRRYPGLVVTIYNTAKPRDRSHYEHFRSYHASIYRQVEPTSVTPFSAPARERALHALLVTLVRYLGRDENRNWPQPLPDEALIAHIEGIISRRVAITDPDEHEETMALLRERIDHWRRVLPPRYGGFGPPGEDLPLLYPAGTEPLECWEKKSWPTPTSMRNVDATCEATVVSMYPRPVDDASQDEMAR